MYLVLTSTYILAWGIYRIFDCGQEMMRSTDRQMSQIENMPGGFNMLRQQFENVVEPMQQAAQMAAPEDSSSDTVGAILPLY